MCLQLVSAFVLALFLALACCLSYQQRFQCLESRPILTRIRSSWLCLLLLRPPMLGSRPSFASIVSVKSHLLSPPLPRFSYAHVALLWWLIPSYTFLLLVQNALSWFVGVLAGCQVNPKTVLVDVIVALVATFWSAILYHHSFGLIFLAVLLGLIPLILLFPRCPLVAQLAV